MARDKINRAISAIHAAPPDLEIVTAALNRWYRAAIRSLADDVVTVCNERGIGWVRDGRASGDNVSDVLHEIVDGAGIVIYTYQAKLAAVATDQRDRPCEDGDCDHGNPSVCAYYVVQADVWDELARRDGAGFTARAEDSED